MGHSQSGRSIRFVFNAAAQSRFQRVCLWKDFTNTYEVSVLLRPLVDSQNCDCVYCVVSIHASLHLLLQVTGWSVRWSQREETSVVWFWRGWIAWLMCTGHIPGSRVTPCLPWGRQESKPLQNFLLQEAINFKHQLIIWGVIANQIDPSFWLKCTLSLFMPNKRPLSFLPPPRSAVCLLLPHTLPSFFGYIHPIIVMGGHFLWRVEKLRFSRSGANRTTISTDSCVTVHARSSGVPADKHTSLHRASCLQNTAAVFSCVYSASAQQHFSNNSFCTWSTAARM